MNSKIFFVAIAIVAAFGTAVGLATLTPVAAQNMTGGGNMTITMDDNMTSMGDNMTQPLEDENMTAGG
jgi:hypothetical protein